MVHLKCQQCGAALHWDGQGMVVRCIYCGAEYLMHPREQGAQRQRVNPYLGRGEVQGIPIVEGEDCTGLCPVESYAPKGWRVGCQHASMDYYGDHRNNPFVVQGEYHAPDGSATMIFRGANLYTDQKRSRVPLLQGIDVLGSYLRVANPFSAEQYCDYLAQRDLQSLQIRKLRVEEADAAERERQQTIYRSYMQQGFTQVQSEWKRVYYAFTDQNRRERIAAVETRINDCRKGGAPAMGGGFFGQMMGQMFQTQEHYWETQYEFITVADRDKFEGLRPLAQKVNESIRTTPDLEKIRQSLVQYIQNLRAQAELGMAQERMASWDRRSKIIQDTHNYTMGVMHEMNANTAATNERVANLRSEAIRGVNTYHTANPGNGQPNVVEASVNWDHVYQSSRNPDVYAATEGSWLEPGVDFEELKRTKGDY